MTRRAKCRQAGITLVETALLLCLAGVLLAVSVPAFVRSLSTSKMSEAPHELSRIFATVAAYYATPQSIAVPTPPAPAGRAAVQASHAGSPPAAARPEPRSALGCMPEAAGPTPEQASVDPSEVEFGAADTPGSATWRALGFEPSGPIRYRYSLLPVASGCGALGTDSRGETVLTLRAEGDLDGDGVLSIFERTATLRDSALALDPLLYVRDRVE